MTIDVATGIVRILKEEGVGWVSTFPVCRVNNALGLLCAERLADVLARGFSPIRLRLVQAARGQLAELDVHRHEKNSRRVDLTVEFRDFLLGCGRLVHAGRRKTSECTHGNEARCDAALGTKHGFPRPLLFCFTKCHKLSTMRREYTKNTCCDCNLSRGCGSRRPAVT